MGQIFSGGGLASQYVEVAEFYRKHTEHVGAESVLVPFTGFGRMASGMSAPSCSVDTVDYQILSRFVVEGVYNAEEFLTNVDKPRFLRGAAYWGGLDFAQPGPDVQSRGFVDWVIRHGTPLDIACLGMSIPSMTRRGHLCRWTGNFDQLWKRFNVVRIECKDYIGEYPGEWRHYEADFFDLTRHRGDASGCLNSYYDVIAVDPPRLCPTQDLYSEGGWQKLNVLLGGKVKIRPWTNKNYFALLRQLFGSIDSKYVLFTWADSGMSSIRTSQVKGALVALGELEDESLLRGHSKDIWCWRVRRHGT